MGWLVAMTAALVAAPACDGDGEVHNSPAQAVSERSVVIPAPRLSPPSDAPRSFADLAAKADPAVVAVKTLVAHPRQGRMIVGRAEGSAFIYAPEGLILTNYHVIEHASEILIVLGQKRELEAEIVGTDPPTDIALLRVDAEPLKHLPLGDSDATRVGDWVVAIGNPFGLSHTVSAGIVSAKGRTGDDVRGLGDGTGYYNFIQTDASINPGNSGGPLIDLAGRVVGINTAIRAEANSIGFAVPINMVKELLPRLLEKGKVRRSAIGISVSSVTREEATRLGLRVPTGALVRRVVAGGPGDRAGLRPDDLILGFEGTPIAGPEKLRWEASLAGVGKRVRVKVKRGSREFQLEVTLGELEVAPRARGPSR